MKVTLIAAFLLATDCEKDLGNWITSKLQPSTQCQKAYTVAVKRTFKFVSKESLNIQYYIKLIYGHISNFVFKPGIYIMQKILIC